MLLYNSKTLVPVLHNSVHTYNTYAFCNILKSYARCASLELSPNSFIFNSTLGSWVTRQKTDRAINPEFTIVNKIDNKFFYIHYRTFRDYLRSLQHFPVAQSEPLLFIYCFFFFSFRIENGDKVFLLLLLSR